MQRRELTTRDRMRLAWDLADRLAHELDVLGFAPQAQIVRDVSTGLYQAQLDRATADLARR